MDTFQRGCSALKIIVMDTKPERIDGVFPGFLESTWSPWALWREFTGFEQQLLMSAAASFSLLQNCCSEVFFMRLESMFWGSNQVQGRCCLGLLVARGWLDLVMKADEIYTNAGMAVGSFQLCQVRGKSSPISGPWCFIAIVGCLRTPDIKGFIGAQFVSHLGIHIKECSCEVWSAGWASMSKFASTASPAHHREVQVGGDGSENPPFKGEMDLMENYCPKYWRMLMEEIRLTITDVWNSNNGITR